MPALALAIYTQIQVWYTTVLRRRAAAGKRIIDRRSAQIAIRFILSIPVFTGYQYKRKNNGFLFSGNWNKKEEVPFGMSEHHGQ